MAADNWVAVRKSSLQVIAECCARCVIAPREQNRPLGGPVAPLAASQHGSSMSLVEAYIFRTAFAAFLAALGALTGVIWVTQSLREFDLMTTQGQTLLMFLAVTGLTIPSLVMIIAPVALFIGVLYALNKLNGDSELVVMSAAGMSPARLLRPFAAAGRPRRAARGDDVAVGMPWSFRELRILITKIRADFLTRIVSRANSRRSTPDSCSITASAGRMARCSAYSCRTGAIPTTSAPISRKRARRRNRAARTIWSSKRAASSGRAAATAIRPSSSSSAMRSTCRNSAAATTARP